FILCFVILWGLFFFRGVGHSDPYIMDVLPDMPAAEAGLKRGDKILTIDGFAIESVQQSRTELIKTFGRTTNIEILRGDDVKIFLLTPVMREMQGQEIPVVGILFHGAPYVGQVEEGSPAFMAGLQKNDKILQVNGKGILTSADVQMAVREARQGDISLKILRDNMQQDMSVTPILRKDKEGRDIPVIGIAFERANFTFRQYDVSASATEAYNMTISIASLTWAFLKSLVQGYASTDHLSGPIKIGSFAGDALQQDSFVIFINLMAWISMSIGLVNLMPVPMLDGGHIVLYLFELITRIKPSRKFQEYAFKTGFIIVMSLMVFTVLNDLGIVNYIKNLGKI
ncbi:MAG: RIP metalloprotease RseP, partial [Pseudomonadota bacterium]